MAVSYNYLKNWPFHVDTQAVTACYTLTVNKNRPVLEFLSSEWASYQRLVVIFSHQNKIKKKKEAGVLECLVWTQ